MIEVPFKEFRRDGDHGELRCQTCGGWIVAQIKQEDPDGSVLLHYVQCKPSRKAWFPTGGLLKYPPGTKDAGKAILSPQGQEQPAMEKRNVAGCSFEGDVRVLAYVEEPPAEGGTLSLSTSDAVGTKTGLV